MLINVFKKTYFSTLWEQPTPSHWICDIFGVESI